MSHPLKRIETMTFNGQTYSSSTAQAAAIVDAFLAGLDAATVAVVLGFKSDIEHAMDAMGRFALDAEDVDVIDLEDAFTARR
jgi:hypothetical protein